MLTKIVKSMMFSFQNHHCEHKIVFGQGKLSELSRIGPLSF